MIDVVPVELSYSFDREVEFGMPPEAVAPEGSGRDWPAGFGTTHAHLAPDPVQNPGWSIHGWDRHSVDPSGDVSAEAEHAVGHGRAQIEPENGPIDLGYPLLMDLGAGEAPYDDGVPTIHGVEMTRGGFSDALLQASWQESVTGSSMIHTTLAVTRFQDLGMLDGFGDMRFAWLVFGWKTSF